MIICCLRFFASIMPKTNNKQPTTNNQQPTTNNQQPTTNNQQPTTNSFFWFVVGAIFTRTAGINCTANIRRTGIIKTVCITNKIAMDLFLLPLTARIIIVRDGFPWLLLIGHSRAHRGADPSAIASSPTSQSPPFFLQG